MKKTIGVLAHVDAGKTTFSEQLLYHTNAIKARGRVDHEDAFLDNHTIEKDRGITVFAEQAPFTYKDSTYYLIDTPGHVDFSPEMERAIQIMDYAIVIVSAVEGVQGHTETVWELLHKHNVPTFFFINKTDREGANIEQVLEDMQHNLTSDICLIDSALPTHPMNELLVEFVAERNDTLFEMYLDSGYNQELWQQEFTKMMNRNELYPCSYGSALKDEGIEQFLENMYSLTNISEVEEDEPFSGRVYKIRYDENGTRLTFVKALKGSLKVREMMSYNDRSEKVTQLRMYNGNKYSVVESVHAGDLFAVIGFTEAKVGDGVGELKESQELEMIPTLKSTVNYDSSYSLKDVWNCFMILDAEDPSLQVVWDDHFQEIQIRVMGVIQLEVLTQLIKDRFHMEVSFCEPEILYKETITSSVKGYGHFEPLRHYAEVHVKLEPGERGSGISFRNACHVNDLSIGNQRLIHQHVLEKEHHGILTGAGLTDVTVTLLTGLAHSKHTSGGDFREATYRALRQGLEKADNQLLEPYYQFKIKVDLDDVGRVLSDIQEAHGTFHPPETIENKSIIQGRAPVATFMHYPQELASFTHGKGVIHLTFSGYDSCHNTEEVIKRKNYNKDADPLYSSNSVFCSKGKGFTVPWYEVEAMLHGQVT